MRPLAVLPPLIFLGIVGIFGLGMLREDPDAMPLATQGQVVPEVVLEQIADKPLFGADALKEGGVKLVNFWASWCTPCRVEHPMLTALAQEGIPVYGINYKDKTEDALAFLTELGDPYRAIGADTRGRNGLDWGVIAMPETFVIDGQGRILLRHAGPITNRVVEDVIRPALAEAGS